MTHHKPLRRLPFVTMRRAAKHAPYATEEIRVQADFGIRERERLIGIALDAYRPLPAWLWWVLFGLGLVAAAVWVVLKGMVGM